MTVTWAIVSTVVGALVVFYAFSEVFLTVAHPHSRGRATRAVVAGVWRATGPLGRHARAASGPLAAIAVILLWTALQMIGWALIYLPHIPEGFFYNDGIDPDRYSDVLEALYFALVSLSTVGFGEMVPLDPTIRLLAAMQAVTGFILLSGAVAWLLQLFPALSRRRATALWLSLLGTADSASGLGKMDPSAAVTLLHEVARQLASVRVDLSQNPESYYFREGDAPTSLGHALPVALQLSVASTTSTDSAVRSAGAVLDAALEDLASCLRADFPAVGESVEELLESFARDHS